MPAGGARPGAGRKPGAANKMSRAARLVAARTGELPHEFLLRVSRGLPVRFPGTKKKPRYPTFEERLDAAKAAAPFYAPRLSAIAAKINTPGNPWAELLAFADGKTRGLPPGNASSGATPSD